MKKKYLFLIKTEGFAGGERLQVDYFKFINYEKYDVTLAVTVDVFSQHFKKNNLPVQLIYLPVFDDKDRFFSKFAKYCKFFKTVRPRCIVFNQYWLKSFNFAEIMAAFFVTRGNSYMIVHDCPPLHPQYKGARLLGFLPDFGLSWRITRLLQTLLGYFTRNTIAVSKASRQALVDKHRFPDCKVKVVYHGVDSNTNMPSRENRIKKRSEFSISDSDSIIVTTAMLWPGKRLDRLVDSFAVLARERKDIHWLAAGAGLEEARLKNMVMSLEEEVRNRIRFLGYQDAIPSILQASDIYVLPSDSEGLPLACLEAMACGLISVVTDCGGTAEIIQDGQNGFLVERSNSGVLTGLRKALNLSPEEKKQMSSEARKLVQQNFDLARNVPHALHLLNIETK